MNATYGVWGWTCTKLPEKWILILPTADNTNCHFELTYYCFGSFFNIDCVSFRVKVKRASTDGLSPWWGTLLLGTFNWVASLIAFTSSSLAQGNAKFWELASGKESWNEDAEWQTRTWGQSNCRAKQNYGIRCLLKHNYIKKPLSLQHIELKTKFNGLIELCICIAFVQRYDRGTLQKWEATSTHFKIKSALTVVSSCWYFKTLSQISGDSVLLRPP